MFVIQSASVSLTTNTQALCMNITRFKHHDIQHSLTPVVKCSVRYAHCVFFLSTCTAPMGSISSMEVNVDVLEQMDLMDISDQEALDVFLNSGSGAEEGALASPLPGALTMLKMWLMSISQVIFLMHD